MLGRDRSMYEKGRLRQGECAKRVDVRKRGAVVYSTLYLARKVQKRKGVALQLLKVQQNQHRCCGCPISTPICSPVAPPRAPLPPP